MSSPEIKRTRIPDTDPGFSRGADRYQDIQEIRDRVKGHSDEQRNVTVTSIFTQYGAYVKDFKRVPDPIRDNDGNSRLNKVIEDYVPGESDEEDEPETGGLSPFAKQEEAEGVERDGAGEDSKENDQETDGQETDGDSKMDDHYVGDDDDDDRSGDEDDSISTGGLDLYKYFDGYFGWICDELVNKKMDPAALSVAEDLNHVALPAFRLAKYLFLDGYTEGGVVLSNFNPVGDVSLIRRHIRDPKELFKINRVSGKNRSKPKRLVKSGRPLDPDMINTAALEFTTGDVVIDDKAVIAVALILHTAVRLGAMVVRRVDATWLEFSDHVANGNELHENFIRKSQLLADAVPVFKKCKAVVRRLTRKWPDSQLESTDEMDCSS